MIVREEFVEKIRRGIIAEVNRYGYEIEDISTGTVQKNHQGKECLKIKLKGINISPVLYIDDAWDMYTRGEADEETVISDLSQWWIEHLKEGITHFGATDISEYSSVKDRVVLDLVGKANNKSYLDKVVHMDYLDLAIVFKIEIGAYDDAKAVAAITNDMAEKWGITVDALYQDALKNTPKRLGFTLKGVITTIKEMTGVADISDIFDFIIPDEDQRLLVLTNDNKTHGAATILYPHMLEKLAEKLNANFFVIPSSIHEVLIVKAEEFMPSSRELKTMIMTVNRTELSPDEVLSDSLYYFDRSIGELKIAE